MEVIQLLCMYVCIPIFSVSSSTEYLTFCPRTCLERGKYVVYREYLIAGWLVYLLTTRSLSLGHPILYCTALSKIRKHIVTPKDGGRVRE